MSELHPRETESGGSRTRLIKYGVSALVFAYDYLLRSLYKLAGRKSAGTCVVLYYHSVPPQQRRMFAEQLDTVLRLGKPVDVTREVVLEDGVKLVGITFDDAFENFVAEALPELEKRRVPATLFVISEALGKAFGPAQSPEKVMTLCQLKSLPKHLISIGSHTVSHPFMPELEEAAARKELKESKLELEQILTQEISGFSFPFGGFTERLVELALEVGYRRVFTTLPQFAFDSEKGGIVVGRVRVDPTDWDVEFRLKVAGAYRWLPWAISWKRRLASLKMWHGHTSGTISQRSSIRKWGAS